MTDHYLRSLGFAPTEPERTANTTPFQLAWRYQHLHHAQDGSLLHIEHPYGIDSCRLSVVAAPLAATDVVATVPLHDRAALEAAITTFFAAHGGQGELVRVAVPNQFRPYRRQF